MYSNKYSKRICDQRQLLVLVLFRGVSQEGYRDVVELVDLMDMVKERLKLDQIPTMLRPSIPLDSPARMPAVTISWRTG